MGRHGPYMVEARQWMTGGGGIFDGMLRLLCQIMPERCDCTIRYRGSSDSFFVRHAQSIPYLRDRIVVSRYSTYENMGQKRPVSSQCSHNQWPPSPPYLSGQKPSPFGLLCPRFPPTEEALMTTIRSTQTKATAHYPPRTCISGHLQVQTGRPSTAHTSTPPAGAKSAVAVACY